MADAQPSLIPDGIPPDLGVSATVVVERESGNPTTRHPKGGHEIEGDEFDGVTVADYSIVSSYTLHVALYALQNPTAENIQQALKKIGVGGDCDEWIDADTLLPLAVPVPSNWKWLP